jgi:hypothetical protein
MFVGDRWHMINAARNRPSDDARWGTAGREPHLDDVFRDPIVHLVMRRDGVTLEQLRAVVAQARAALRGRLCLRCAA